MKKLVFVIFTFSGMFSVLDAIPDPLPALDSGHTLEVNPQDIHDTILNKEKKHIGKRYVLRQVLTDPDRAVGVFTDRKRPTIVELKESDGSESERVIGRPKRNKHIPVYPISVVISDITLSQGQEEKNDPAEDVIYEQLTNSGIAEVGPEEYRFHSFFNETDDPEEDLDENIDDDPPNSAKEKDQEDLV